MSSLNHRSVKIIVGAIIIVLIGIGLVVLLKRPRPATQPSTQQSNQSSTPSQTTSPPPQVAPTTNPLFGIPCKDNPKPVFTHDLTDPTLVDHIQIYGLGEIFPRFRSFIWINQSKTKKVPIYAPIDSDLVEAVYKNSKGALDFDVHMMVSCQIWYLVNHITDPVDKIRAALPSTPATNTMDPPAISPAIHFASGELLGYTSGTPLPHNWDFGVFDLTHANQFVNQARYDQDKLGKFQTAICPLDLFPESQKATYYGLIGETKPVANAKCGPISPDKAGTISGSWFETKDLAPDHQLHFKLMIGIYTDGAIRISGEDFQPTIEIPASNSSFLDPTSVTDRHCYAAGGKSVDFKVVSDQEIHTKTSSSCPATFPSSGYTTYWR